MSTCNVYDRMEKRKKALSFQEWLNGRGQRDYTKMSLQLHVDSSSSHESSRKNSLMETIINTSTQKRKDSVAPMGLSLVDTTGSGKSSASSAYDGSVGTERTRRMSRKLSLKPPSNVYRERRESHPKSSQSFLHDGRSMDAIVQHNVTCECGRDIIVPCHGVMLPHSSVPTITLSGVEVTDLKKVLAGSKSMTPSSSSLSTSEVERKPSLQEAIQNIKSKDYETVYRSCQDIGNVDDQDSLDVVLSRQTAIRCLLEAIQQFYDRQELVLEACKSLLMQVQQSEASLHYLTLNNGLSQIHAILKRYPENLELVIIVLDIFGYFTSDEERRAYLSERVNPSDFLSTMARHDTDVNVVQKCCVVIGNLVLSDDLARSLMYVGGVHSIISIMNKHNTSTDILKHCCAALGNFASHDDTCQVVAEAGGTKAVMSVMTAFLKHAPIQESCCWALASLSRSDCACMELLMTHAVSVLVKTMEHFTGETCIQEYGCWALCNLTSLGSQVNDTDCMSVVELLIDWILAFGKNVELLEHICYAISNLVTLKECVHENVVKRDGVNRIIELMRTYEDDVDIQINGCQIMGNLSVNADFRMYVEDMGASESIIACMLKNEKSKAVQCTSCMALTNLSAELTDNKFRILKNGGVHAVLQAMSNFMDDEAVQLNALKVLCNLIESDQGCWWIAEETGVHIVSMALRNFTGSLDILNFGLVCLSNLPRRGINLLALEDAEATLLYLRMSLSTCCKLAKAVCVFYVNILKAGSCCRNMFTDTSLEKVLDIMREFDEPDVLEAGAKVLAQLAIDENAAMLTHQAMQVMMGTMAENMSVLNLQIICCGTIAYMSSSEDRLILLSDLDCVEAMLGCMEQHPMESHIHNSCLVALTNICKASFVRGGQVHRLCDAVSKSMKNHPSDQGIQQEGYEVLTVISDRFRKQNEFRRQSMDIQFMTTCNNLQPSTTPHPQRKSVTDELLEVASAAFFKFIKFKSESTEDESTDEPDVEICEVNPPVSPGIKINVENLDDTAESVDEMFM